MSTYVIAPTGADIMHYGKGHDDNPPGRGSGRYAWGTGNGEGAKQKKKRKIISRSNKKRIKAIRNITDDKTNSSGLSDLEKEKIVIEQYNLAKEGQYKINQILIALSGTQPTGLLLANRMDKDLEDEFKRILQHIPDHGYEDY
jgi:hypothetical protein